jgi:chemotaxis protein MotA
MMTDLTPSGPQSSAQSASFQQGAGQGQAQSPISPKADTLPDRVPKIRISAPPRHLDLPTLMGLGGALAMIAIGIALGNSKASFLDLPSVFIVVFGTIAGTCASFSADEIRSAGKVIGSALISRLPNPSHMTSQLLDMAVFARKKSILSLSAESAELNKDPFIRRGVELVTDGYIADDIHRILGHDIDALVDRHRRSASILRRGAELAPAMGLIGTLIGLVQMLADIGSPEKIGPAMAVALLTTFYGAVIGSVILTPMAAKLERNSEDEAMIRSLVLIAMESIARQENPRRLEILLNTELPPHRRVRYFD